MEKTAGSHHSASVAGLTLGALGVVFGDSEPELLRPIDAADVTYYLGRESVLATNAGAMGSFAEGIFGYLQRNSVAADRHFMIPGRQVIEVGLQLDL